MCTRQCPPSARYIKYVNWNSIAYDQPAPRWRTYWGVSWLKVRRPAPATTNTLVPHFGHAARTWDRPPGLAAWESTNDWQRTWLEAYFSNAWEHSIRPQSMPVITAVLPVPVSPTVITGAAALISAPTRRCTESHWVDSAGNTTRTSTINFIIELNI